MKALYCSEPGTLEYKDIPAPEMEAGKSIIRIRRIGICGTDLHAFEGTQPFFSYPRILGHELSGTLMDADSAEGFEKGETVTFIPYFNCQHCLACRSGKPNCCVHLNVCGVHSDGGMVEYLSVPSRMLVHAQGLDHRQLALTEPLAIGAHGIRRAQVTKEDQVLVIGAGPIGLGTLLFAKKTGANVIVMDTNEDRLQFCREKMNVQNTINPVKEDPVQSLAGFTNSEMPSVVIDATGNLKAINDGFRFLGHGGQYVLIGLQKDPITFSHPEFHKREATLMSSRNATRADFLEVIKALRAGWMDTSAYISHEIKFDELKRNFQGLLNPANGVIKAMVEIE